MTFEIAKAKRRATNSSIGVLQVCRLLEAVTKREFHHAWPSERLRVLSETAADIDFRKHAKRVESHGVGDVIDAPVEREPLAFGEVPALVKRHVDTEVSRPAQI